YTAAIGSCRHSIRKCSQVSQIEGRAHKMQFSPFYIQTIFDNCAARSIDVQYSERTILIGCNDLAIGTHLIAAQLEDATIAIAEQIQTRFRLSKLQIFGAKKDTCGKHFGIIDNGAIDMLLNGIRNGLDGLTLNVEQHQLPFEAYQERAAVLCGKCKA